MSKALFPKIIPVNPPDINVETNPIAKSIAGLNWIFPFQRVAI
jgi:hypothetical protein